MWLQLTLRILPNIVIRLTFLVIKRITFCIIGKGIIGITSWLRIKPAIFGCRIILVSRTTFIFYRLVTILIHVKNECLNPQTGSLFIRSTCPISSPDVLCMRPIGQSYDFRTAIVVISRISRIRCVIGITGGPHNRISALINSVRIAHSLFAFKGLNNLQPMVDIRNIVGQVYTRHTTLSITLGVVRIHITNKGDIASYT